MKPLKLLLTTLTATALFFSCKKDSNSPPKPVCRIVTITPGSGDAYNITYNTDGKIASIVNGASAKTLQYNGSAFIINETDNGAFGRKSTVLLNQYGLAVNIRSELGSSWANTANEYNGDEVIKSISTSSAAGTPTTLTVTWSNGNMIAANGPGGYEGLDYYMDKTGAAGDYLDFVQLIGGFHVFKRTKNLLKSYASGGTILNFTYTWDGDGKITSMTVTPLNGTPTTYNYQYACN